MGKEETDVEVIAIEEEDAYDDGFAADLAGDVPAPSPENSDTASEQAGKDNQEGDKDDKAKEPEGENPDDSDKTGTEEGEAKEPTVEEKMEGLEKRLEGNAKWNHTLSNDNASLKTQLDIVNKKLDGTYVEEEEAEPNIQEIKDKATMEGKLGVSRDSANEKFGKEFVDKTVFIEGSPYRVIEVKTPGVGVRVLASDNPIKEAIKVVEEHEFFTKHGTVPKEIQESIEKKYSEKMRKEITENVTKEIMTKLDGKGAQIIGLHGARKVSDGEDTPVSSDEDEFDRRFG